VATIDQPQAEDHPHRRQHYRGDGHRLGGQVAHMAAGQDAADSEVDGIDKPAAPWRASTAARTSWAVLKSVAGTMTIHSVASASRSSGVWVLTS
jgi:hypothetical protein